MPCKRLAPIFDEISKMEEFKDVDFKTVDVDEDDELLSEKYQIRSVPTIVFVDENGESIKKIIGLLPSKDTYINEIREELAKDAIDKAKVENDKYEVEQVKGNEEKLEG